MNIGQAARASGVSTKMIRYYEETGLLPGVRRSVNGYRVYADVEVHTLAFVRRARSLGFSVAQIEDLLRLWRDKGRASAEVKAIAEAHVAELEAKAAGIAAMARALRHLADFCQGDARPDCPILEDLAGARR